ncbi:MAG: glycosyltransferase [Sphingomonadaceae bacterium]|nr:glycosyltransferase [Sphingomonadaceae bacterium]
MADAPPISADAGRVGLIDIKHGKVFIHADADVAGAGLQLERHGAFAPAAPGEILERVNLLADSDFRAADSPWRTKHDDRALVPVDVEGEFADIAPISRRALRVEVQREAGDDSNRYFIVYEDSVWRKRIPVIPGAPYRFRVRLRAQRCGIGLRCEFFDAERQRLPDANVDVAAPKHPLTGAIDSELVLEATPPPGATAMSCMLMITTEGDMPTGAHVDAWIGEPMLWCSTSNELPPWKPRPAHFEGYQALLGKGAVRAWAAPMVREGAIDGNRLVRVTRGDGEAPLLELDLGADAKRGIEAVIGPLESRTLRAKVRQHTGFVRLLVDGEHVVSAHVAAGPSMRWVSLVIPERFFDGNGHLLELLDDTGLRRLAIEYMLLPMTLTQWRTIAHYSAPPLPGELDRRAGARLRAMRAQLEDFAGGGALDEQRRWLLGHLARIVDAVTAGIAENRDYFPLRFPPVEAPRVSVIVPAHNQYAATFVCLASLLFARNEAAFEVIAVDDGSSDRTAEELAAHEGITVVTNEAALGFIGACKSGVEKARGEYLLFLNNDVEVTAGWIDELLAAFDIFPGTGAAASKLLFPDGQLQDAGGLIWQNGAPWNYGRRQNAAEPRFSYSRDADYLSGAALITPREVWDRIGGFADELRPAYYEDTWYSFAVREIGLRTIYCATSLVYHVGGVTGGTDVETETGHKRFQKLNEPKFRRRWADVFRHHGPEGAEPDLQKDRRARGRVLVLDWSIPRPDNDAGGFASVQEMRLFQRLGYKVTFFALNLANLGSYVTDLNRLGIEVITAPFAADIAEFLRRRGAEFDIVLANRHNVGGPVLDTVRALAPRAKVILNVADLHFLREMRAALIAGDREAEVEAHALREHELAVARKFDLVLSYSDFEVGLMEALLGSEAPVDRMPWVQPIEVEAVDRAGRSDLCFLGSHNHPPNAEAVAWFASAALPRLPGVRLHVYGSNWSEDKAGPLGDQVEVGGHAPDLGEMFARHRICVVPLRSGAGVKGKVLMAMAHGVPCILSPVAAEALAVVDGAHCLIARTDDDWVTGVERLCADDDLWRTLSAGGLSFIADNYSPEAGAAQLARALEKIDIFA